MEKKHWVIFPPATIEEESCVTVVDQTDNARFFEVDDDNVDLVTCVCGAQFEFADFLIGRRKAVKCPHCLRWFYFKKEVHLYEVTGVIPLE